MSYAHRPLEAGGERSLAAARTPKPSDAGTEFAAQSRKVQALVGTIQGETAIVRKQAQLLRAPGRRPTGDGGAREAAHRGRAAAEDARHLLQGLETPPGTSVGERSAARLRHRKLSESLVAVLSEFEASWSAFEAAEAARAAAGSGALEGGLALCEEAPGADVEAGHPSQRLETIDIAAEAELEIHGAMVDEYTQQVGVVTRHVMDMRRALLDLANHTRSQGQMVESLEQGMSQAADATSGAREHITITSRKQQKTMKCVYWALLLVVLLALAIACILRWRR
uniref:t-SNARE coiled-coil homology domain-containing protein n=1 Tax=Alexandrium monilatum TaxID=311494 RepID=A0A7S4PV57_9DINO